MKKKFKWSKIDKYNGCSIEIEIPIVGCIFGEIFYDEEDKFCLETDPMENDKLDDFCCSIYDMKSVEEAKKEFEKIILKGMQNIKKEVDKYLTEAN